MRAPIEHVYPDRTALEAGLVKAIDVKNTPWLYAPTYRARTKDPFDEYEDLVPFCQSEMAPSPEDLLKAAHVTAGVGVTTVLSPIIDQFDPARLINFVEQRDHVDPSAIEPVTDDPHRAHHCHYQATIDFAPRLHRRPINLHVDRDYLRRDPDRTRSLGWEPPDSTDGCSTVQQCWMM